MGLYEQVAEALGYRHFWAGYTNNVWHSVNHENGLCASDCMVELPDYRKDEKANAYLLDSMLPVRVEIDLSGYTHVSRQSPLQWTSRIDRKEAIFQAFLRMHGIRSEEDE